MENVNTLLGIAGGIIALVVVLVGVGRSYYKNQELVDRAKILEENRELQAQVRDAQRAREEDCKSLQAKLSACEAQRDQLNDQITLIGRAGGSALAIKSAINSDLQDLMQSFAASGGSIYVPVAGPRGNVQGLAFLCIEPFTPENQQLKNQIIPLRSLAGQCFTAGRTDFERDVTASKDHFKEADSISNYVTASTVNVALKHENRPIGVLQLLRQKGEPSFTPNDVERIRTLTDELTYRVLEATRDLDAAKLLGLSTGDLSIDGTALIFDLTNSALLFQELAASHALVLLNDYFECLCGIGFEAGGTLDTYMGDGALLRFNVPRDLPNHERAAVECALRMVETFRNLRDARWLAHSPKLENTHLRVGISTGPLVRATLGHSQMQHLTVLGYPVSVASALCSSATRDRSVVIASEETIAGIRGGLDAQAVDPEALGKSSRFTTGAYEIRNLDA